MLGQLGANTVVLLRFFARNRLLLGFGMVLALMASVSLVPMLFIVGSSTNFEIVKGLLDTLEGFALLLIGALGLLAVSSHVGNRTLKMVVTKPCSVDVWVGALYASAAMIGAAISAVILGVGVVLCLAWRVPLQAGMPFVTLQMFSWAMIVFAYFTLLSAVVHPVVAALLGLVVNGGVFYQIMFFAASGLEVGKQSNVLLKAAFWVGRALYFLMPDYTPFSGETGEVRSTLAVKAGDWTFCAGGFAYAVIVVTLCYFGTVAVLRRKRLV